MSQIKLDKFLEDVLSYIRFPFVKDDIRLELESHVLDKIDHYIDKGYSLEEAEELAINEMGNAKEIGTGLNKQHNPLLGWMLRLTNHIVILALFLGLLFIVPIFLVSISEILRSPIHDISKDNIEYRIDLDQQVKIDNRIINFTNIIYDKDGNMNIIYNSREKGLFPGKWGPGSIGTIYDDLGNEYISSSGSDSAGIVVMSRHTIKDFPAEAEVLIIDYDSFNRKYRVEIPLMVGDEYD